MNVSISANEKNMLVENNLYEIFDNYTSLRDVKQLPDFFIIFENFEILANILTNAESRNYITLLCSLIKKSIKINCTKWNSENASRIFDWLFDLIIQKSNDFDLGSILELSEACAQLLVKSFRLEMRVLKDKMMIFLSDNIIVFCAPIVCCSYSCFINELMNLVLEEELTFRKTFANNLMVPISESIVRYISGIRDFLTHNDLNQKDPIYLSLKYIFNAVSKLLVFKDNTRTGTVTAEKNIIGLFYNVGFVNCIMDIYLITFVPESIFIYSILLRVNKIAVGPCHIDITSEMYARMSECIQSISFDSFLSELQTISNITQHVGEYYGIEYANDTFFNLVDILFEKTMSLLKYFLNSPDERSRVNDYYINGTLIGFLSFWSNISKYVKSFISKGKEIDFFQTILSYTEKIITEYMEILIVFLEDSEVFLVDNGEIPSFCKIVRDIYICIPERINNIIIGMINDFFSRDQQLHLSKIIIVASYCISNKADSSICSKLFHRILDLLSFYLDRDTSTELQFALTLFSKNFSSELYKYAGRVNYFTFLTNSGTPKEQTIGIISNTLCKSLQHFSNESIIELACSSSSIFSYITSIAQNILNSEVTSMVIMKEDSTLYLIRNRIKFFQNFCNGVSIYNSDFLDDFISFILKSKYVQIFELQGLLNMSSKDKKIIVVNTFLDICFENLLKTFNSFVDSQTGYSEFWSFIVDNYIDFLLNIVNLSSYRIRDEYELNVPKIYNLAIVLLHKIMLHIVNFDINVSQYHFYKCAILITKLIEQGSNFSLVYFYKKEDIDNMMSTIITYIMENYELICVDSNMLLALCNLLICIFERFETAITSDNFEIFRTISFAILFKVFENAQMDHKSSLKLLHSIIHFVYINYDFNGGYFLYLSSASECLYKSLILMWRCVFLKDEGIKTIVSEILNLSLCISSELFYSVLEKIREILITKIPEEKYDCFAEIFESFTESVRSQSSISVGMINKLQTESERLNIIDFDFN